MLSFYNHKIKVTGKRYGYKSAAFDLSAGHTCPAASLCHSRVVVENGKRKIEDFGQFRCYATKAEVLYPNVYNLRLQNHERSKQDNFVSLVIEAITAKKLTLIRIHSSGDFYDFEYFKKWYAIVQALPHVTFFAYTKQATFVKWYLAHKLPNLAITYSMGGLHDKYALQNNLPSCTVVLDEHEINNDGTMFRDPNTNAWIPLACLPDNIASDFEYIMRGESFGIKFH